MSIKMALIKNKTFDNIRLNIEKLEEDPFKTLEFGIGIQSKRFGNGMLSGFISLLSDYKQPNLEKIVEVEKILEEKVNKLGIPWDDEEMRFCINTAILSAAYFNPETSIMEPASIGMCMFFLCVIYIDDILDKTEGFGGIGNSGELAKKFLDETTKALEGGYKTIKDIPPTIPSLDPIIRLGFQSHEELSKAIPEFGSKSMNLRNSLREDVLSGLLMKEEGFGDLYSNETYRMLRSRDGGFYSVIELILLVNGITISNEIRSSLVYKVLMENAAGALSLTNDVLGLQKEIINEEFDNLVLRLVDRDKVPLEEAFNEVNMIIRKQRMDVNLAIEKLSEEFPDDEQNNGFIEVVKTFLDGHLYFSIKSKRYGKIDANFV